MPFTRKHRITAPGIQKAIEYFGSKTSMAKALGVSVNTIDRWLIGIRVIPPKKAFKISKITKIPLEDLFPENIKK